MSYALLRLRRLALGRWGVTAVAVLAVVAVTVTVTVYFAGSGGAGAAPASSTASVSTVRSASVGGVAEPGGSAGLSGPTSTPAAAQALKPPAGGWIPVDEAAWQRQVEAYRALAADPVPAGVGNLPEFRADCRYSHSAADDPIVFPGLPGASHMHSFVGNAATGAATGPEDLAKYTATSCKPAQDHSAYWVPTLYDAATNAPVETTGFRVYYRSLQSTSTGQLPMPNGLRMVAGDATKHQPTPRGARGQFYCAFYGPGDLDGVARSANGNWPICGGTATLHFMLQFPDCWDGKHLDSPNHRDHVAFGSGNTCPAGHPVKIPAISFDIQYGARGTAEGYYLSSDKDGRSASSMHGDAMLMWDADTMNHRTKDCVAQRRTCDDNGYEK